MKGGACIGRGAIEAVRAELAEIDAEPDVLRWIGFDGRRRARGLAYRGMDL